MRTRPPGSRLRHVVALGLILSLPVPSSAHAAAPEAASEGDTAETRVKAKYDEGSALYSAADYAGAIASFTEALKIVTAERLDATVRGALLLNLAKAHVHAYEVDHDASHLRQAKSIYSRFVQEAESEDVYDPNDVNSARKQIEEMDAALEKHESEAAASRPSEGPRADEPAAATEEDPARTKKLRGAGIGLTVAGSLLVAGSIGLIVYGSTFERSFEQQIIDSGDDPADYQDKIDAEASRGALVMGMGAIPAVVGVGALIGGIVLLVKNKKPAEGSARAAPVPVATGEYAGLSWSGRF